MKNIKIFATSSIAVSSFFLLPTIGHAQSNPAQSFENALNRSLKQMDDAREEQRDLERLRIEQERLRIEQEKLKLEREAADRAKMNSNPNPATNDITRQPDLEAAKRTCTDLGFTVGSEKFGECVLKLMPIASQAQPQIPAQSASFIPNDKQALVSILGKNGWNLVKEEPKNSGTLFELVISNGLNNRSIAVYQVNQ